MIGDVDELFTRDPQCFTDNSRRDVNDSCMADFLAALGFVAVIVLLLGFISVLDRV
jgi:hypothetical protein